MPRRSTEWSTASSCTRVATCMSSSTAASVVASGAGRPATAFDRSTSVGRNSFPFIPMRCRLTPPISGESSSTIRQSSWRTRSRSPSTGAWMADSDGSWRAAAARGRHRRRLGEVRASSPRRPLEHREPLRRITEFDIHGKYALIVGHCGIPLRESLGSIAKKIEHAHQLVIRDPRLGQRPAQDRRGDAVLLLLEEALPQRLVGPRPVMGPAQGLLKLGDRLVDESHLLVRDAQIVMAVMVFLAHILGDSL